MLATDNPAIRDSVLAWLERFAGYVREVDYRSAREIVDENVLAFGTHRDVIFGLDPWMRTQWDNVWPRTSDFRFTLEAKMTGIPPNRLLN